MKHPIRPITPTPVLTSSLIYGPWRVGKTHLLGTFPRLAWLGAEREEGYLTLQNMKESDWYEPDHPPQIFGADTKDELLGYLHREIVPQVLTGKVLTIGVELSIYMDDVIRRAPTTSNGWEKWAQLEQHILWLDEFVKRLRRRQPRIMLAYNALARAADDSKVPGGILLPGKALPPKLPAIISLIGYYRNEERAGAIDRVLHLQAYGPFLAGHRFGARLPGVVRNPTYRKLEDLIAGKATVDRDGNVDYGKTSRTRAQPASDLQPRGSNSLASRNGLAPRNPDLQPRNAPR